MADDLDVSIGAQIGGLNAGLRQASAGVNKFSSDVQSAAASALAPFQKLQDILLTIGAIAAGGAVFGDIIKSTLAVTSESTKLAKSFGESLTAASELRVELKTLGIGTDDYRQAAMMMDRQVRANETTLRANGLVTRDANGALLNQRQLLQNGVEWLRQYKEGTDRNIAAQAAFGRGAADTVMQLLKMTTATREQARQTAADLGLIAKPEDQANLRQYKTAMGELALTFEGIKKSIGEAVLPYLTQFAKWFREQGPGIVTSMKSIMKDVIAYAFELVGGLANFALDVVELIVKVGAGVDNLKTRAGYAGAGAIIGGGIGLGAGGVGAIPGALIGGGIGWIAGGMSEGNDEADAQMKRLEDTRKRFAETLKAFRDMMTSGATGAPGAGYGAPEGGTKSASGLVESAGAAKTAAKEIDGRIAVLKQGFEQEKLLIDGSVAAYRISEIEKTRLVRDATDREYQGELELLQKKLQINGLEKTAKQEVENAILTLEAKHRTDSVRLDQQAYAARQRIVEGSVNAIENSWNGSLRGLLAGTVSLAQAMKKVLGDLVIYWIEQLAKKLVFEKATAAISEALFASTKTAEVATTAGAEVAKTTATVVGVGARVGAEETGSIAIIGTKVTEALSFIGASLAEAFAGLTAFYSFLGPGAPLAAAATVAGVGAAAFAMLPKLETGAWKIPRVMPALLHPGERVLNAKEAAVSRGEAPGGGGGGDTFHVQAVDAAGVARFIEDNAPAFSAAVTNHQQRNRSARPKW